MVIKHWLKKYLVDAYYNHRAQQRETTSSIQRYNDWVSIIALPLKREKYKWALYSNELEKKYGTSTWNILRVHNGFKSDSDYQVIFFSRGSQYHFQQNSFYLLMFGFM